MCGRERGREGGRERGEGGKRERKGGRDGGREEGEEGGERGRGEKYIPGTQVQVLNNADAYFLPLPSSGLCNTAMPWC